MIALYMINKGLDISYKAMLKNCSSDTVSSYPPNMKDHWLSHNLGIEVGMVRTMATRRIYWVFVDG